MKLTGLQIYKLLPQTNCKECGFQTCLAFAMKLAAGQANLDDCPYVSDELKQKLGEASAPPIRLVTIGSGDNAVRIGEELVLFRHEKTFFHKTALAPRLDDSLKEGEVAARAKEISAFSIDRAGESLRLDLVAIRDTSGDPAAFSAAVKTVRQNSSLPLVLITRSPDCARTALKANGQSRPLLWGADRDNAEAMAGLAAEFSVPLVAEARGVEETAALACRLEQAGAGEIVLAPAADALAARLRDFTLLRRKALERSLKGAGFPLIASIGGEGCQAAAAAAGAMCKYASVIVLESSEQWEYLPLLTLRQNIYTDPQKPLQVDPGIYPIGEPGDEAPLLVTTNFSLTYFMVSTEIEASEVPSRLLIVDAEGQSVLTAWAAGKFSAEVIAKAVAENECEKVAPHRKIIIPGYVAMLSGDLEDKLAGWNVMVGPQESADIPSYMKEVWQ